MKVTVIIIWPNGGSYKNTWDLEIQGQRRTMGMEIHKALIAGATVVSSKHAWRVEVLAALHEKNSHFLGTKRAIKEIFLMEPCR